MSRVRLLSPALSSPRTGPPAVELVEACAASALSRLPPLRGPRRARSAGRCVPVATTDHRAREWLTVRWDTVRRDVTDPSARRARPGLRGDDGVRRLARPAGPGECRD